MDSESPSRGVDLFFAQEFCFFKREHGPPRGSKQVQKDVLLTTVLGLLRGAGARGAPLYPPTAGVCPFRQLC